MAGFTNLYPNLPGHLVEFKDGGLALRTEANPPQTGSMLILGTAIDGPVMEPVAVDATTAELVFGKAVKGNGIPNGATLIPAFEEAWNSGCRDVRLMRISGGEAVASVEAAPVTKTLQRLLSEQKGLAQGNDTTVIQLASYPVVPGTVLVAAKGSQLLSGYTTNYATGEVTIAENAVDAGATISVEYEYFETVNGNEDLTVVGNTITLAYEPVGAIVVKDATDTIIPETDYVVDGKEVVFSGAVIDGDVLNVEYTGNTGVAVKATENGNGSVPFTALTSEQVLALQESPVPGTVHVYANGAEILTPNAFTVDGTNKEVKIKKEFFPKGSVLEVSYMFNETKTETPKIEIRSNFGGEVYNQATVEIKPVTDTSGNPIGHEVIITKPETKKAQIAEEALKYNSLNFANFKLLVDAINNDPNNGIFKAVTAHGEVETSALTIKPITYFVGGKDGLNLSKEQLFTALSGKRNAEGFLVESGAYQLLEDYQVDEIVPAGVFADDELPGKFQNFAYELAMFCAVLTYRNKTTIGTIAMKPIADTGLAVIQEHAKKLAAYENLYFMRDRFGNIIQDSDGQPIDLGRFLNVVAGPEIQVRGTSLGNYFADGAVMYAAMNTVLQPQSAPTNKRVEGARGLRYRFSNAQLDAIAARRLVTFKIKQNGDVCVVDAPTSARPGSDYARLTTVKVVRETVDQIREVCEPFIGEPNTIEQRNSMSAAISKRLGKLKELGVIQDYDFQVVATMQDQLLGQAKIELTLVPPQELRKITTVVSLKPSL